jgi:hypothetical protein
MPIGRADEIGADPRPEAAPVTDRKRPAPAVDAGRLRAPTYRIVSAITAF